MCSTHKCAAYVSYAALLLYFFVVVFFAIWLALLRGEWTTVVNVLRSILQSTTFGYSKDSVEVIQYILKDFFCIAKRRLRRVLL